MTKNYSEVTLSSIVYENENSKYDELICIRKQHKYADYRLSEHSGNLYTFGIYHDRHYVVAYSGDYNVKLINRKTKEVDYAPMIYEAWRFDSIEDTMEKFYYLVAKFSLVDRNEGTIQKRDWNYNLFKPDMNDYLKIGNLKNDVERFAVQSIVARHPIIDLFIYESPWNFELKDTKSRYTKNIIGSYNGKRRYKYNKIRDIKVD